MKHLGRETRLCAIIDHRVSGGGPGLQALEQTGLWVTQRQGQRVKVLTGQAWVSFDGRDHILRKGDGLNLGRGSDLAIVTGLKPGLMVLEVEQGEQIQDPVRPLARK